MKIYSFEKLEVWKNARDFTVKIYTLTKTFPDEEKFGLTSQLRRSSLSITCNIAEGTTRWSNKERIRFIEIAYSSLMEVLNCLLISYNLELISKEELISLRYDIDEISNKLNALAKSYK